MNAVLSHAEGREQRQAQTRARGFGAPGFAERIGRLAIRSLYHEAALYPKPGLVSPIDNGSHVDMSMATFYRSLFALRSYFPAIARAGATDPELASLQALGLEAERAMLQATAGVNTHRGAIFNLGLLCASAGRLQREAAFLTSESICRGVAQRWGHAIRNTARITARPTARPTAKSVQGDSLLASHGLEMLRRYGAGGARAEAAAGFPNVINASLPAYRGVLDATGDSRRAAVQALFVLIGRIDDSNLLWRGGLAGARFARGRAATFLRNGGAIAADWLHRASTIHREFVARNLSPGGSADLLAVTLFLHSFEASTGPNRRPDPCLLS